METEPIRVTHSKHVCHVELSDTPNIGPCPSDMEPCPQCKGTRILPTPEIRTKGLTVPPLTNMPCAKCSATGYVYRSVFIIHKNVDYEFGEIRGISSDKEKAIKEAKTLYEKEKEGTFSIEEWTFNNKFIAVYDLDGKIKP